MKTKHSFSKGKKHASSRITRQIRYTEKEREKYPLLAEKIIQMSDIILEILDARFIAETKNSELEEQIKKEDKKIIYVLNKSDLVDLKKVDKSVLKEIYPYVFVSCVSRKGGRELRDKIKIIAHKIEKPLDNPFHKITAGVIGYPNTGKSSIINILTGKTSAGVGADAGFTKGIQKVNLTSEIVLLDSPGVIPNKKYSSSDMGSKSRDTKLGARSHSQIENPELVVSDLVKEFPLVLERFYNIPSKGNSEILIEELGRQKNFLSKGGNVDEDKTARFILKDWQEGKIRR